VNSGASAVVVSARSNASGASARASVARVEVSTSKNPLGRVDGADDIQDNVVAHISAERVGVDGPLARVVGLTEIVVQSVDNVLGSGVSAFPGGIGATSAADLNSVGVAGDASVGAIRASGKSNNLINGTLTIELTNEVLNDRVGNQGLSLQNTANLGGVINGGGIGNNEGLARDEEGVVN